VATRSYAERARFENWANEHGLFHVNHMAWWSTFVRWRCADSPAANDNAWRWQRCGGVDIDD
jgi:hypothetical protein